MLRQISKADQDLIYEICCALGAYVAPYVNRQAIRRRTPEACLAQRLFDYDDVVSEFIPMRSEQFYLAMKRHWDWNSRYWEQFALLKLDKFINATGSNRFDLLAQAISHARHAVQIERHAFCLTTLGRVLLEDAKQNSAHPEISFNEAFDYLDEAIWLEGTNNRVAIHPYMTLFRGVSNFLKQSGSLSSRQLDTITKYLDGAPELFGHDRNLMDLVLELKAALRAN